jgi:hypothetical protein
MNRSRQAQVQAAQAQGGEERLPGMLEVNVTKPEELVQKLQEAIEGATRTRRITSQGSSSHEPGWADIPSGPTRPSPTA